MNNFSAFLARRADDDSSLPLSPPTLFGFSLSTHRLPAEDLGENPAAYFEHEALIAAISILFFRWTVRSKSEPRLVRLFFGLLLATLAYRKKSFELITAVEIFSYAASWLLLTQRLTSSSSNSLLIRMIAIAASAATSIVLSHIMLSGRGTQFITLLTPGIVVRVLKYLFPIEELKSAYEIMEAFADENVLRQQISHLFFVTFHIQVGMGFLGISFLREEQSRRNDLIRLDVAASSKDHDDDDDADGDSDYNAKSTNGTKEGKRRNQANTNENQKGKTTNARLVRANQFQKGAFPFIFGVALPYMLQIILLGNINKFAFSCVENDMHRTIRLTAVFEHDNHLTTLATDSATSPEVYASAMDSVLGKSYEIFNRKLFSLPKVLLLPGVMARQPMLVVQVFPFIFLSDWIKASAVSFMTTKIEDLRKETMELKAMRTKVESFDLKHAELLQRSGKDALKYTHRRWEDLTVKIQCRECISDLLVRSKGFFAFMQRNFVFTVLIDCALASLIAIGKIVSAEIFVFSRAIEDTVDMVLMRSRSEAELAQMSTEIQKLQTLVGLWDHNKRDGTLIPCVVAPPDHKKIVFRNLHYTRGTASVRADHVELLPGVYALTGPNGSGKSTLFKILMSCTTNEQRIALPDSIFLLSPTDPLTEEDDLMRENCCVGPEEGESEVDREECEVDLTVDACVDASRKDHHPIPKLSVTMPSSHVVEISQTFYWPLYSRPLSWIYQHLSFENLSSDEVERKARIVAEHLHSLEFFQPIRKSGNVSDPGLGDGEESFVDIMEATISQIQQELLEEKEDWFNDLSGGQKSKIELVRKVFLQGKCPEVLLVDETMAPLDPASKAVVMAKMKDFCRESVVIVIYHTDVNRGVEVEGETVDCVPSNNFFDQNIHLEHGLLHLRPTC